MNLQTIHERLGEKLQIEAYADVDASANGIQVGPSDHAVEHVAFAVDAAAATIATAANAGADLLVTHHGISWDGIERVTGHQYGRIAALIDSDIALYAVHLPLDGHPGLGNAAGLADLLGLEAREPFGELGPVTIGRRGRLPDPMASADLADHLDEGLATGEGPVRALDFGPETVADVAIVTGAGADWLDEAVAAGVDAYVTGEGKHRLYHEAREAGINVYLAGHYATETVGVRALQAEVAAWDLETTFIDRPTGL